MIQLINNQYLVASACFRNLKGDDMIGIVMCCDKDGVYTKSYICVVPKDITPGVNVWNYIIAHGSLVDTFMAVTFVHLYGGLNKDFLEDQDRLKNHDVNKTMKDTLRYVSDYSTERFAKKGIRLSAIRLKRKK